MSEKELDQIDMEYLLQDEVLKDLIVYSDGTNNLEIPFIEGKTNFDSFLDSKDIVNIDEDSNQKELIEQDLDNLPEDPQVDIFLHNICEPDVMPSYKDFTSWVINTYDLNESTDSIKQKYGIYYNQYKSELRDWWYKRHKLHIDVCGMPTPCIETDNGLEITDTSELNAREKVMEIINKEIETRNEINRGSEISNGNGN